MNPTEDSICSVDGCTSPGLIAETKLIDYMTVWVVWCGPHMIERKGELERTISHRLRSEQS